MATDALSWITLGTSILGPAFIGWKLFIWNKDKEYTFKKAALSGAIYGRLFDFNNHNQDLTFDRIILGYHLKYKQLLKDMLEENQIEQLPDLPEDNFEEYENLIELNERTRIKIKSIYNGMKREEESIKNISLKINQREIQVQKIRRKFAEVVGEYRFYVKPNDKIKFDEILNELNEITTIDYEYKDTTPDTLQKSCKVFIASSIKDFKDKYSKTFSNIMLLIDES